MAAEERFDLVCARAAARALFDACPDYGMVEEIAFALGLIQEPQQAAKLLSLVSTELHTLHDEDVK